MLIINGLLNINAESRFFNFVMLLDILIDSECGLGSGSLLGGGSFLSRSSGFLGLFSGSLGFGFGLLLLSRSSLLSGSGFSLGLLLSGSGFLLGLLLGGFGFSL